MVRLCVTVPDNVRNGSGEDSRPPISGRPIRAIFGNHCDHTGMDCCRGYRKTRCALVETPAKISWHPAQHDVFVPPGIVTLPASQVLVEIQVRR